MPLFLNAAFRINKKVKDEVKVSGTIVGPFTMAALLRGFENFVNDMIFDADYLIETGTSLLIADSNADWEYYKKLCKEHDKFLRVNIDSGLVEKETEQEIKENTEKLIDICGDYNKFIFGCGVVSYDTDPKDVLKLKEIVKRIAR
ncbi:MAG: hypothetical protein ACOCRX_11280 [Candidatus Woesearchaeota archaeon]